MPSLEISAFTEDFLDDAGQRGAGRRPPRVASGRRAHYAVVPAHDARLVDAWAGAHGYEAMVTDRRVTKLLSSRFWPARGFRPTFPRLHRLIA